MLDAVDRWENEGGAVHRDHRPDPLPADPDWAAAATTPGRIAFRRPAASLALATANHGPRSYLRRAAELDRASGEAGVEDGGVEID
jgi:hypothetical protein